MTNNHSHAARLDDPQTSDFTLALERDESGAALLVLSGELDLYRAPAIEEGLAELLGGRDERASYGNSDGARNHDDDERRIAVDLSHVSFIDSTTLALLLHASRRAQAQNEKLLVLVGPQTPMTAFKVTGFDRLLALRRAEDDGSEGAA